MVIYFLRKLRNVLSNGWFFFFSTRPNFWGPLEEDVSYEVNFFYCVCLCTCVYVQVRNKIKQVHSSDEVLCPTLCNPMDCSPPGSSVHGDSPGQNTGMVCHVLLQGIFLTQGLNPGLQHCRWILYHLSHQWWGDTVKQLLFRLRLLLDSDTSSIMLLIINIDSWKKATLQDLSHPYFFIIVLLNCFFPRQNYFSIAIHISFPWLLALKKIMTRITLCLSFYSSIILFLILNFVTIFLTLSIYYLSVTVRSLVL